MCSNIINYLNAEVKTFGDMFILVLIVNLIFNIILAIIKGLLNKLKNKEVK
ncbi:hypothetical protein [uncultured Clostridium sp.]|uniref:hypothetical protein n=1 Tax=uncultured Clostridium sp. TaxID=59620 RepID=UPI00321646D2